jgi:hypothetical protein
MPPRFQQFGPLPGTLTVCYPYPPFRGKVLGQLDLIIFPTSLIAAITARGAV